MKFLLYLGLRKLNWWEGRKPVAAATRCYIQNYSWNSVDTFFPKNQWPMTAWGFQFFGSLYTFCWTSTDRIRSTWAQIKGSRNCVSQKSRALGCPGPNPSVFGLKLIFNSISVSSKLLSCYIEDPSNVPSKFLSQCLLSAPTFLSVVFYTFIQIKREILQLLQKIISAVAWFLPDSNQTLH